MGKTRAFNAVKTHIQVMQVLVFKPLNTNFSKFFAQIFDIKKKKKKKKFALNPTLFFRILRFGRERAT